MRHMLILTNQIEYVKIEHETLTISTFQDHKAIPPDQLKWVYI